MAEFCEMLETVVAKRDLAAKDMTDSPMSSNSKPPQNKAPPPAPGWPLASFSTAMAYGRVDFHRISGLDSSNHLHDCSQTIQGDLNDLSWATYVEAMRERIASAEFTNPLAQLAKDTPGHKCIKSQLYQIAAEYLGVGETSEHEEFTDCHDTLEMLPDENEFNEQPTVSLRTIYGTTRFQTMPILCKIKNHTLIALEDAGSTHNFLNTATAKFMGTIINPRAKIEVSIANGESMKALGCDIVLGIQWLVTLGPIVWDFEALNMQFQVNQQWREFQGIPPDGNQSQLKLSSISETFPVELENLLHQNAVIFKFLIGSHQ
ncbi:hypothetical protein COLO4_20814 [Corchorus olitorius]|uniref:Retroviral aspartyl protease n=1 Tax=Corchorus olitorius TaxID=93759 RepID=A0A1R3IWV4_9ROSI|nr:hypothetical protein COLO4_20814 [Corchorus olitorius]